MTVEGSAAPPVLGTREDVHVTGRRILATVVDGLVFAVLYTVMTALFGNFTVDPAHIAVYGSMPTILPNVIYGLLVVSYYILMEGYLGQTLGKILLGIRVVREDGGEVPGLKAAAIRTLLRLVDGLFSYAVAFVTVLVSGKNQRLGDMAAHTLVVRR
jgi:uncharacterized RDD family membrane protein YckC